MWEMPQTQVQCLGQEDPPEEEMATHFSILAMKIPCYSSWGHKELDTTEHTHMYLKLEFP